MTLHLIGTAQSACTLRALLTLAEKGVKDFNLTTPNMAAREHKSAKYLAKQPFGVIPIIEETDFRLYESRAIARYIAQKYSSQGTRLIPDSSDPKTVAIFEQCASVEVDYFDRFATPLIAQRLWNPRKGIPTDPSRVTELATQLAASLDVFNNILSTQSYMCGNEFSLIDIFYMPTMGYLFKVGFGDLVEKREAVMKWWSRVSGRKSWRTVGLL